MNHDHPAAARAALHIGYLVQQFVPEVGAGPARVLEMGTRWLERGAELTIVTAFPNRPEGRIHAAYRGRAFTSEGQHGMRVLRSWLYASPKHGFARTLLNNLTFLATGTLHGLARGGRPDVLIASSPPFFPHIGGVAIAAARRVPLVLEIRDLWPDYLADMGVVKGRTARALFALERALLRRAAHVVVVTDAFRERVVAKGVSAERITVIPNGVELDRYRRTTDEAPPLPSLVRRPGEFLVGYLGNMGAGQGLGAVLDAAARVAETTPHVRFVLAGDGPERERLHAAAAARGLHNVALHPPIPKDATRAFYNACDVCLVPLAPVPVFQETVPSKLFEILACERPIVASLGGEGRRIVAASGGGVVVPPGDGDAIAAAVLDMMRLPEPDRAAMGVRGRAFVAERYSREALADRYFDLLGRVVADARGAR